MAMTAANPGDHHIQVRSDEVKSPIDLGELLRNRELLMTLADRDVKVRYKQTALGVVWVVLQPLLASLIFTFVFGVLARMPSDNVPYILFAFAGLMAWNTFSQTVIRASSSLLTNAGMISKVYFPRLILPLSSAASTLVDFAVTLGMMFVLLAFYRIAPGPGLLLLPVWLAILMTMGLGIGLIAGSLAVKYRDVTHIIPAFIQLGFYASPVAWSSLLVPGKFRWVFLANPLSGLLDAFRWSLLGHGSLSAGQLAYATATAVLLFWVGAVVFKKQERDFADVI